MSCLLRQYARSSLVSLKNNYGKTCFIFFSYSAFSPATYLMGKDIFDLESLFLKLLLSMKNRRPSPLKIILF